MATKIIIRTPNHLGDCIMALPMINDLHEAYPDSHVTVMTPEYLFDLFDNNPSVEKIIQIPKEHVHGLIAVKKGVDLLMDEKYDVGYILPPSFGSAATFKLAGVDERIGYITDGRRLLLSRPLPLPSPIDSEHRSELYYNLIRRATGLKLDFTAPKIFLSGDDTLRATEIVEGFGIENSQTYTVIAPQAVAESRRWGAENYGNLAALLSKDNKSAVLFLGTDIEFKAAQDAIAQAISMGGNDKLLVNLCGKTSLRESAAIIAGSRLFVGNDSGPAHLAASVGTPLVVLSGADNPAETSPISSRKELVIRDELECISCVKNKCPLGDEEQMKCMKLISVDDINSAVVKLMNS